MERRKLPDAGDEVSDGRPAKRVRFDAEDADHKDDINRKPKAFESQFDIGVDAVLEDGDADGDIGLFEGREEVQRVISQRRRLAAAALSGSVVEDTAAESLFAEEEISAEAATAAQSTTANGGRDEVPNREQQSWGPVPFEAFNMREELQEGSFDESGHYVWRKKGRGGAGDLNEFVIDSWLDSVDAGDESSTFKDKEMIQKIVSLKESDEAVEDDWIAKAGGEGAAINVALEELTNLLIDDAENPTAALRRLKDSCRTQSAKAERAGKSKQECMNASQAEIGSGQAASFENAVRGEYPEKSQSKQEVGGRKGEKKQSVSKAVRGGSGKLSGEALTKFERITELCDFLMSQGHNVYFMPRESVHRRLSRRHCGQGATGLLSPGDSAEGAYREDSWWQYRWTIVGQPAPSSQTGEAAKVDADGHATNGLSSASAGALEERPSSSGVDLAIYGPFSSRQMAEWRQTGCFSAQCPIELREVNEENDPLDGLWRSWDSVDFDAIDYGSIDQNGNGAEESSEDEDHEEEKGARRRRGELRRRGGIRQEKSANDADVLLRAVM